MTQVGIVIGIVVTVILAYRYEKSLAGVIAKSTALFFALCASTFLPSFVLGLFWKRMNRKAAVASMVIGFAFSAFWLAFLQGDTAAVLGVTKAIWGMTDAVPPALARPTLITSHPWPVVDAMVFALPLSFIVAVFVALVTKPMSKEHLDRCFSKS